MKPEPSGDFCNNTSINAFAGCEDDKYGPNCAETCQCSNGGLCDRESGACTCPAGWIGATCQHACPVGFYGVGCSETCSCMNESPCDPVSGKCQCSAGYTGSHCETRKCFKTLDGSCSRENVNKTLLNNWSSLTDFLLHIGSIQKDPFTLLSSPHFCSSFTLEHETPPGYMCGPGHRVSLIDDS